MNDVVSGWGELRVDRVTTPEEYAQAAKLVRKAEAFMARAERTARQMFGTFGTIRFSGVGESTAWLKKQMAAYIKARDLQKTGITDLSQFVELADARYVSADGDQELVSKLPWGIDLRSFDGLKSLQALLVELGIKITNISFEFVDPPGRQLEVVSEEREAQAG